MENNCSQPVQCEAGVHPCDLESFKYFREQNIFPLPARLPTSLIPFHHQVEVWDLLKISTPILKLKSSQSR